MNQHQQQIYGVVNCAYFNAKVSGDVVWYATAHERDAGLQRIRTHAMHAGLSYTAASAGIYPTSRIVLKRNLDQFIPV